LDNGHPEVVMLFLVGEHGFIGTEDGWHGVTVCWRTSSGAGHPWVQLRPLLAPSNCVPRCPAASLEGRRYVCSQSKNNAVKPPSRIMRVTGWAWFATNGVC